MTSLLAAGEVREAHAQTASRSAWEAADFRIWGYVPNWTTVSQINAFNTNGIYDHVSDVLYFGGVQPKADGTLYYASGATNQLAPLKTAAQARGFALHSSMFTVNGGATADVWNAIISSPTTRATFVTNVKNFLVANNMKGYNLDWERPANATEWGNYTQLARELRATLNPLGIEVSVCDFGSTDYSWDNTALFDAKVYDQIFMMSYHLSVFSTGTYANQKLALTGQGAAKAFSNDQIGIGFGTWGVKTTDPPATVTLEAIVQANPNLPYDALTFTGTIKDISGNTQTATWNIESRKQIREKVQLAIDRGMPGLFSWTMNYDATGKYSLHRVAQHYAMVKKQTPDLNLDGKVDAADANALADNMGTFSIATGTAAGAQIEAFYWNGNWEKGDRDGNGYVNQADATWLAGRYAALGVALPDRLAFTGEFEKLNASVGLSGRWKSGATRAGFEETGNFRQQNPGNLPFAGTGVGASKYSASSVTIRNQTAGEVADGINGAQRTMKTTLAQAVDLAAEGDTYITFVVRQSTASLTATQLASTNRTLSLELLNSANSVQYDFSFHGQQTDFSIRSQADAAGDDVTADGFAADATYLFVGKISGNGTAANTLQASLFAYGSNIGNFTDPQFQWMLTANGGAGFDPVITQLQFKSSAEGNFSVSNLWVGQESSFFAAPIAGDFNADGKVDAADLELWKLGAGTVNATHWDGDANADGIVDGADFLVWQRNLGQTAATGATVAVPEPSSLALALIACVASMIRRRSVSRPPSFILASLLRLVRRPARSRRSG
ncbi:glycosyl hydrolase family 18 protein [Lacipirellula sp.]|uniref:glycosyl hydrolase family 18 protein n=1 Tax=Lacipirellula sp. TaxID=2691419 RepID=UPI003D0A2642